MTTLTTDLGGSKTPPFPGSQKAAELGCECPRSLNNMGEGYVQPDGSIGGWIVSPYCDLHREATNLNL